MNEALEPNDFRRGLCFKEECMCIEVLGTGVSTCCSAGPEEQLIEGTY